MTIAAPGFETEAIQFRLVDSLDIIINADTEQLAQQIGTKRQRLAKLYGQVKKKNVPQKRAQPQSGFEALEKAIKEDLNYPKEALKHKIEGKVKIQFTVKKNGQLTNFKVVESLGFGCDEEAIRLLKNGPKWVLPAGYKKWVDRYEVIFELGERE